MMILGRRQPAFLDPAGLYAQIVPDPSTYRPAPGTIPELPGVYRFRDPHERVIYVGKAKSLRQRLNSYFADPAALHTRTFQMVTTASSVDWVVVGTEVEALQLEYNWIKEYDPRFNVRYRDDKSYPSLAVTLNEEYPRLHVMRGSKKQGVRYFGPYAHAWAIRETLDLLLRVFPARTCSAGVFKRASHIGRPCLLGYIGKCSAPCVGRVSAQEHRAIVDEFVDFMAGKTEKMMRRLEKEMVRSAAELDFEKAARLRDDIAALSKALEKQAVVLGDGTDADVIAFAEDELQAAVQVFHVRTGRVRGQRGWIVDKVEDVTTADLVVQFCLQVYGEESAEGSVPREVLVPQLPADPEEVQALTELLEGQRGGRVSLRVPRRGDKRALIATVHRNAEQALAQHKLKRASDLTARSRALTELQTHLGLGEAPLRIECYDISHGSGQDVVGSMVVFEDGVPRRSEYRKFNVRGEQGNDDTAALAEVLGRRFQRFLAARAETGELAEAFEAATESTNQNRPGIDPTTGKPRKFAYPPNLVVVDGGQPQVNAAARVLRELGLGNGDSELALVGLAKRLEEVWLPNESFPTILPRTSEALYLLQRIRDEAHRFAITHHRKKRAKRMTVSVLDDIPGLGETRKKALLRYFGSVRKVKEATPQEITQVAGIGPRLAQTIREALTD